MFGAAGHLLHRDHPAGRQLAQDGDHHLAVVRPGDHEALGGHLRVVRHSAEEDNFTLEPWYTWDTP